MVTVIDIGLPGEHLVPTAWALSLADLPEPDPQPGAHKYRRGVVGVTAGSGPYPGAAVLAVAGARRSGVGMVALRPGTGGQGADDPVGAMVVSRFPDVVLAGEREVQARCIGPGLAGDRGADLVLDALSEPVPVVVDASGLQVLASAGGRHALAERAGRGWPTVLTPHAGEFARLGFDLSGGPLEAARRAATALGAVIVLKGPGTVVAEPGGTAYIDTFGTVALATAGSGDVLAGLMAGMLARPRDVPTNAQVALTAARAVGLHGLAGRLAAGGGAVTALDVAEALDTAVETARAGALPG